MIFTNSVLRGYRASLGFFLLSIAFLFGSFSVTIPPKEELEAFNLKNIEELYGLQILVHILATINSILRFFLATWKYMEIL